MQGLLCKLEKVRQVSLCISLSSPITLCFTRLRVYLISSSLPFCLPGRSLSVPDTYKRFGCDRQPEKGQHAGTPPDLPLALIPFLWSTKAHGCVCILGIQDLGKKAKELHN